MNQEVTPQTPTIEQQIEFIRGARHYVGQGITDNVVILKEHEPMLLKIEENLLAVKLWNRTNTTTPAELVTGVGKEISDFVNMLKECKIIMKYLHGLGMTDEDAKVSWKIYEEKAPGMIRLNVMINKFANAAEAGGYEFKNPIERGAGDDYPVVLNNQENLNDEEVHHG